MTTYSPILAIPEIAQNQNNKYITHNNAVKFLEWATNRSLNKTGSYTANQWTPTEAEFTQYFRFKATGLAAATEFMCPAAVNGTTSERIFAVENADTTYDLTVKVSGGTATVIVHPGTVALLNRITTEIVAVALLDTAGRAYDLGFFVPGLPTNAGKVLIWKAVRPFKLLGNALGSQCKVVTNPASTAVFDIQKNESSVGSISISTGGVATFTTTAGAAQSFAVGDRLMIVAPSPQDAALADVGISLFGLRT